MMKALRLIEVFLIMTLFLFGCSNKELFEADTSALIQQEEERLISYYKDNKDCLQQIGEEFLRLHSTLPGQPAVQLYVGNEYLDFFRGEAWNREALANYEYAKQLIEQLTENESPIATICATGSGHFFSGKVCEFHYSLGSDNDYYYSFSLFYCEDPDAVVKIPEISVKLDEHWYFVGYDLE